VTNGENDKALPSDAQKAVEEFCRYGRSYEWLYEQWTRSASAPIATPPSVAATGDTPRCNALESNPLDSFDYRAWVTLARQLERDLCGALAEKHHWRHEARQAARSAMALPKEPPMELLVSMAMRVNHGFGLDDARSQEVQISDMRKVYEEVSGHGFYSEEVKGRYSAMMKATDGRKA
jgi:hypothetical protein